MDRQMGGNFSQGVQQQLIIGQVKPVQSGQNANNPLEATNPGNVNAINRASSEFSRADSPKKTREETAKKELMQRKENNVIKNYRDNSGISGSDRQQHPRKETPKAKLMERIERSIEKAIAERDWKASWKETGRKLHKFVLNPIKSLANVFLDVFLPGPNGPRFKITKPPEPSEETLVLKEILAELKEKKQSEGALKNDSIMSDDQKKEVLEKVGENNIKQTPKKETADNEKQASKNVNFTIKPNELKTTEEKIKEIVRRKIAEKTNKSLAAA